MLQMVKLNFRTEEGGENEEGRKEGWNSLKRIKITGSKHTLEKRDV